MNILLTRISHKLSKYERLTSKKQIRLLFQEGGSWKFFPIKVFYIQQEKEAGKLSCHRVLFAVPKRNIPLATHRNKIKRWLREAYRIHKHILHIAPPQTKFSFLIGYVYHTKKGVQDLGYPIIKRAVIASLQHVKSCLTLP